MATRNLRKDLYRRANRSWTVAELSFVRNSVGKLTTEQMSEKLGRSPSSIRNRTYQLGYDLHGNPLQREDTITPSPLQVISLPGPEKQEEEPVSLSLALDFLKLAYEEGHPIHISISGLAIFLMKES